MAMNHEDKIAMVSFDGEPNDGDMSLARLLQEKAKRFDNTPLACYRPADILQHKDYVINDSFLVTEIGGQTLRASARMYCPAFKAALKTGIPDGIKTFRLEELPMRAILKDGSGECQMHLQLIGAADGFDKKVRILEARLLMSIDPSKMRITSKEEYSYERQRNALLSRRSVV